MILNFDSMGTREKLKAHFILKCALDIGIELDGEGSLSVNDNTGEIFLQLNDYEFKLFMSPFTELELKNVWVKWQSVSTADEEEESLDQFDNLDSVYGWIDILKLEIGV